MNHILQGGTTVDERSRMWHNKQISKLYSIAITSPFATIRREAMKILGVHERAGDEEAAVAIEDIKKKFNHN